MFFRSICFFVFTVCIFSSCNHDLTLDEAKAEEFYNGLKPGETKAVIQFNHELFYPLNSIFKGKIIFTVNKFSTNLFDQFDSNCAFAFEVGNWNGKAPFKVNILPEQLNKYSNAIMIGRMLDKQANKGEGYVMPEGKITIKTITKDKVIVLMEGKLARYSSELSKPELWKPFTGILVWKNPGFVFDGVKESDIIK